MNVPSGSRGLFGWGLGHGSASMGRQRMVFWRVSRRYGGVDYTNRTINALELELAAQMRNVRT